MHLDSSFYSGFFKIEVQLIYSIMLAFGVQQSFTYTHTQIYIYIIHTHTHTHIYSFSDSFPLLVIKKY